MEHKSNPLPNTTRNLGRQGCAVEHQQRLDAVAQQLVDALQHIADKLISLCALLKNLECAAIGTWLDRENGMGRMC